MVDYALLAMGIYFFTWLISFILGIILESPVIGISKKLFRNEDGKKQEKKNTENTILIKNN
jgi:deoxyinosine 3'endonuclease (endonuclease V)